MSKNRQNITFLKSCAILLYLFSLSQIFWLGLSKETNFWALFYQALSNLSFWIISVTLKHFSNHDVNIKPVSSVKSSKQYFVSLFYVEVHLQKTFNFVDQYFSEQTNIFEPKLVLFYRKLNHHWNTREENEIFRQPSS